MSGSKGVVTLASDFSFDETVAHVLGEIKNHGLLLFLDLDQQAAARGDGLAMPQARLLLFGRPSAGTPILAEAPEAGLDLPLKIYVWGAADGMVFVSYSDPAFIAERHGLSAALAAPLYGTVPLIKQALGRKPDPAFPARDEPITEKASNGPTSI